MTGDGRVMKKRLREGTGEFPVDCPLHDTTVRLHYRVRSLAEPTPGPWVFDSRTDTPAQPQASTSNTSSSSRGAAGTGGGEPGGSQSAASAAGDVCVVGPVEVDTGCGELPEGLELVVKLMVPGELASATCQPRYAYEVRPHWGHLVGWWWWCGSRTPGVPIMISSFYNTVYQRLPA